MHDYIFKRLYHDVNVSFFCIHYHYQNKNKNILKTRNYSKYAWKNRYLWITLLKIIKIQEKDVR